MIVGCLATASPAGASHSSLGAVWPLDEGSGDLARDLSGHSNHGTLGSTTGADANDPSRIPGAAGYRGDRALRFSGDDFVTVPDSSTLEPTQVTVGVFVRAAGSPGSFRYIVSKGAMRCVAASYGLYTGVNGGLQFYISNGSEYTLSPDAGQVVWDGRWHWVFGTFDGTVVRLYVDGYEVGSGSPTSVAMTYGLPDDERFYIGDYRGTCESPLGFVGDIDAPRVWHRAFLPPPPR